MIYISSVASSISQPIYDRSFWTLFWSQSISNVTSTTTHFDNGELNRKKMCKLKLLFFFVKETSFDRNWKCHQTNASTQIQDSHQQRWIFEGKIRLLSPKNVANLHSLSNWLSVETYCSRIAGNAFQKQFTKITVSVWMLISYFGSYLDESSYFYFSFFFIVLNLFSVCLISDAFHPNTLMKIQRCHSFNKCKLISVFIPKLLFHIK